MQRFTSVDPHAENYYDISPYVYCHNNPIRLVDPDGRDDKDKVEFKLPNLSDIVHGVLATFGCDPQVPKTDSKQSLEESQNKVDQQAETRSEVKKASKEALVMGAHKAADGLETTGTVMQGAGYVLAIPTEGVSLSLIPAGKKIEAGGSFINAALDISEGKTGKAAANIASSFAFGAVGRKVEHLKNVGKIAKNENVLLQLIIDVHAKITSFFTNSFSDKK